MTGWGRPRYNMIGVEQWVSSDFLTYCVTKEESKLTHHPVDTANFGG